MSGTIPCVNLIERDEGSCILDDRKFPEDCRECAAYIPGLNEQERTRGEVWRQTGCGLKRIGEELSRE